MQNSHRSTGIGFFNRTQKNHSTKKSFYKEVILQREDPIDVEQVDAVGDVLFGGGLPEERRRFLQRLVGQVEGAPVDGVRVGVF